MTIQKTRNSHCGVKKKKQQENGEKKRTQERRKEEREGGMKGRRHYNPSVWKDFERKVILLKHMYIELVMPSNHMPSKNSGLSSLPFILNSLVTSQFHFLPTKTTHFWSGIHHNSTPCPINYFKLAHSYLVDALLVGNQIFLHTYGPACLLNFASFSC